MRTLFALLLLGPVSPVTLATEFHVSVNGNDANAGTAEKPFKTISAAALAAQPGDVVTVHEGVYRELVNPPRGGESDAKRIIYQAAPGEKVAIKGSEVVKGWEKVQNDTWKAVVPNRLFGSFNPYQELIRGDWFNPKDREHHRGAVYLNGDWLIEATKLDEVMAPAGTAPAWLNKAGGEYLLNVAWLQPANTARVGANSFTAKNGTQNAPCSEGGECIGFILNGHWVKYEKVDFGQNANQLEIRAASASRGGIIEVRLDAPDGELVGSCSVPNTGDWQSWESFKVGIKPVSGVKALCLVFKGPSFAPAAEETLLWYAKVDADNTTIWGQFKGVDPNEQLVEINVRARFSIPARQTAITSPYAGSPCARRPRSGRRPRPNRSPSSAPTGAKAGSSRTTPSAIRSARASRSASTATSTTTRRPTPPRAM